MSPNGSIVKSNPQAMTPYDKKQLAALASETGFLRDNLEKVVRLVGVLGFIDSNPLLASRLALKGGTAINLTVFQMPRLSVDIDLDYCNDCDRDEMMSERETINSLIHAYMTSQGYVAGSGSKSPHSLDSWVFAYVNAGGNRDNIKIEINYSMRCHLYPVCETKVSIPFLDTHTVRALAPMELFGSKIKALVERSACRDLYDVNNMIEHGLFPSDRLPNLRKTVLFYLAVGGSRAPQHDYTLDSIRKLGYRQVRASLIPVLRKQERFNFEQARIVVADFVEGLLRFTESEQAFIDSFNQGQRKPELLFQDPLIVERIQAHPMALWKTQQKCEE